MNSIDDKSIDMILCDLPYNTTNNNWDKEIIDLDRLWNQYNRIIKENGAIVLTSMQPFTSKLIMSNPKMFKYEFIWIKNNSTGFLNAKKQPLRKHESVLVFYKKQPIYNPQFSKGKKYIAKQGSKTSNYNNFKLSTTINSGFRYPNTILKFNSERGLHPTQKPVSLFEYLIKTFTNEGDLILDNCAGSGTSGVAAINTNRKYLLIEKEKEYYDLIIQRIENHKALINNAA